MRLTVKKKKKKTVKLRSLQGQISKKVLRVVIRRSPRQWVHTCDRSRSIADVKCAFEGEALAPVRHHVDLHHPPAFTHAEKEKNKKKKSKNGILQLFEIVSLLISQLTLNLQGSAPAWVRQTALKHVHVGAGCDEEEILSDTFKRIRALCERLCES